MRFEIIISRLSSPNNSLLGQNCRLQRGYIRSLASDPCPPTPTRNRAAQRQTMHIQRKYTESLTRHKIQTYMRKMMMMGPLRQRRHFFRILPILILSQNEKYLRYGHFSGMSFQINISSFQFILWNIKFYLFYYLNHFRFKVTNSILVLEACLPSNDQRNQPRYQQFEPWSLSLTCSHVPSSILDVLKNRKCCLGNLLNIRVLLMKNVVLYYNF